jgi:hypothetical protein
VSPLSPRHGAPQLADGGDGPPIWRVAANILNKQSRTADKGWSSSLGVGRGANGFFGYPAAVTRSVRRQCLTLLGRNPLRIPAGLRNSLRFFVVFISHLHEPKVGLVPYNNNTTTSFQTVTHWFMIIFLSRSMSHTLHHETVPMIQWFYCCFNHNS